MMKGIPLSLSLISILLHVKASVGVRGGNISLSSSTNRILMPKYGGGKGGGMPGTPKKTRKKHPKKKIYKKVKGKKEDTDTARAFISIGEAPAFQILSCDDETVVVDGVDVDQLVDVEFLVHLSDDASMACTSCNPLYRKILSVSTDSSDTSAIIITTSFATFGDIYLGVVEEIANDAIEPSLGCDEIAAAFTRNLVSTTNGEVESFTIFDDSNDVHANDRRRLAEFPSTCSEWEQTNPDGTCVYTECYVTPIADGSRPPDRCFFCWKDVCDNGCGAAGSWLNTDGDFGTFDFGEACCIHDYCWSSIFTKAQCDTEFLRDLMDQCRAVFDFETPDIGATDPNGVPYGLINVPIEVSLEAAEKTIEYSSLYYCIIFGHSFYNAVRHLGDSAYISAIAAQSTYEVGDGPPNDDDCSGCCQFRRRFDVSW